MSDATVNQLTSDMLLCKKLCEDAHKLLNELVNKLNKLEIRLEHINSTSQRSEKDIDKLQTTVNNYYNNSITNRQSIHDLENDLRNAKEKLSSINTSTMTTDDNLSRLRTEFISIKETINRISNDVRKMGKDVEELEKEINANVEDINKDIVDFKNAIEERVRKLEDNSLTIEVFKKTIIGAVSIIGALSGLLIYFI